MITRAHLAILHASAWLVPARRRPEWLAEWKTELWYAMESDGRNLTAFCLGAFRDALWLRRNAELPRRYGSLLCIEDSPSFPEPPEIDRVRFLESPGRCLAMLAVPAALSPLALLFHPVFAAVPVLQMLPAPLMLIGGAWISVVVIGNMSLGEYPRHRHCTRRWGFLAAKIGLISVAMVLTITHVFGHLLLFEATFWAGFFALRWAFLDQRQRCPACLRLLDKPVRIGNRSRILLEWSGTELICSRGHGVLHVPESPSIWFSKQRWLELNLPVR